MRLLTGLLALTLSALAVPCSAQSSSGEPPPTSSRPFPRLDIEPYRAVSDRIIEAALADSAAYERLAYLADTFGHRLSGSESLERAIDWMLAEMAADGLDNVRGEPVMVPHWVRGEESVELVAPRREPLPMLGLGGSVGTPPEGITAEVLVVRDFDELEARRSEVPGRIVVFNAPFTTYGETVRYRLNGASEAARHGAVASLIRSVGPVSLQTPHTGTMRYAEGIPEIPHAALTIEGAELLQRMQDRGERPVVTLKMEAETRGDAESRNAIGELVGRERPDEIVVIGGHIDSWDVGQGAVDDAGGVVVTWEALRLLHDLGLRPRRTIRFVAWTNEENGLRGARAYAAEHADDNHVLALESDSGTFAPVGFGVTASDSLFALIEPIERLLEGVLTGSDVHAESGVFRGGGGADIAPLMAEGVPGVGFVTDAESYFWVHHTAADTVDKLDPADLARCVAAVAVFAYVVAEMPEGLPQ